MTVERKIARQKRSERLAHSATAIAIRSTKAARACIAATAGVATSWRRGALDLTFPAECVSCRAELTEGEPAVVDLRFCRDCYDQLSFLADPLCLRCGGPLPKLGAATSKDGCYHCRSRKLWFDQTIAVGLYEGLLRDLVLRMKRSVGDALSLELGKVICQHRAERLASLQADVIVPIPLHWRRRWAHQTNSAAVLAEVVSRRLGVPLAERLLRRRRHTVRQSELTPPQRWDNVRRAFSVRAGYHLEKAHVLVVDDILTTGATCSAAARTLRRAGAERVTVAVVARGLGGV